ncbi:hypothetical protein HK405_009531, partial [Cladochytrium tenue]
GDVRLALCLRDAGILVERGEGFYKEPPTKEAHFPSDACQRPKVFHHALPAQMQALHDAEASERALGRALTMGAVFWATVVRHDVAAAGLTTHGGDGGAPESGFAMRGVEAHGGDVVKVVLGGDGHGNEAEAEEDETDESIGGDGGSDAPYAECAQRCAGERRCVAWALEAGGNSSEGSERSRGQSWTCWLKDRFVPWRAAAGNEANGDSGSSSSSSRAWAGYLPARYVCAGSAAAVAT